MKKVTLIIFTLVFSVMIGTLVYSENINSKLQVPTALTAADVKFLIDKCLIDRADIDIISQLEKKTQQKLVSKISKRNCELIKDYKVSRNHFRKKISTCEMIKGPGWPLWNLDYLTEVELKQLESHMLKCL